MDADLVVVGAAVRDPASQALLGETVAVRAGLAATVGSAADARSRGAPRRGSSICRAA